MDEGSGRRERIRTSDRLHPMQVRYQAALRPDRTRNYIGVGSRRLEDFRYRSNILRMLLSSLRMFDGEIGCGTVMVFWPPSPPTRACAGTGMCSSRRLRAPLIVKPCS